MNMMMKMLHQNHHHRPFSTFDADGPTTPHYSSLTNNHHHHNINSSAPLAAAATTTPSSAFNYSGGGGNMAASSLGFFPFTSAQWKELERQAMIYKYMMASVPVPPDLLLLTPSSKMDGGGFNLRLSNSTDPEPGRCKRTDGKKWRCSRDVAPNHKYCERHMHRGRPRSRKPVEVHTNNISNNGQQQQQTKRPRHDCVTVAVSNPSTTRKDGPSSSSTNHFLGTSHPVTQPYLESSLSLDNFGSVASSKEPRGLDWMLNGDPVSLGAESEWHSLMNNKVGMNAMSSCNDTEPQYLNSFALYGSALYPIEESLQSEKPRGFIDAWSNAGTEENNADNKNSVAPIGKLSLSSLDLSMGGGYMHEDMGLGQMMEHDGNNNNTHNHHSDNAKGNNLSNWLTPSTQPWLASSTPGGPLAEVLRPSTVNSNPSSPAVTATNAESNSRTMVSSSPSGVLHKALASLSDSSGNSSPTVASSGANSEIALLRFNHKSN